MPQEFSERMLHEGDFLQTFLGFTHFLGQGFLGGGHAFLGGGHAFLHGTFFFKGVQDFLGEQEGFFQCFFFGQLFFLGEQDLDL
jgi:hypothetical protein